MRKTASSLFALAAAAAGFAGCTILPPTAEPPGALWRSWKRDIGEMQKLTDKYFFNYDYDDPFNE